MTHTGFPSQCSPNSDRCLTRRIQVDLQTQQLRLIDGENRILRFPVSTAMNGPGEESGSGCTPRGLHVIRIKIGEGLPLYAVFKGRRPTGEIYNEALSAIYPERDWILTRILWLSGRQRGVNRGGSTDTLRRFIYIHGCPDSEPMGVPRSHGCIRMRNGDLIELFDKVESGMEVDIF